MHKSEQPEHRARKRFGQNFLEDSGVISAIGNAISPQPNDHIVEIGPGLGALTSELIGRAKQLTLIELDRDLLPKLEQKFQHQDAWSILSALNRDVRISEKLLLLDIVDRFYCPVPPRH